jgi:hypothetical protein
VAVSTLAQAQSTRYESLNENPDGSITYVSPHFPHPTKRGSTVPLYGMDVDDKMIDGNRFYGICRYVSGASANSYVGHDYIKEGSTPETLTLTAIMDEWGKFNGYYNHEAYGLSYITCRE